MRLDGATGRRWRQRIVSFPGFRVTVLRPVRNRLVSPGANVLAWLIWISVAMLVPDGRAHDPGLSTAEAQVRPNVIEVTTGFAPDDAKHFLVPELWPDSRWSELEFETVREPLERVAPTLWDVRVGGEVVQPGTVRVQLLPGDNVSFHLEFPTRERSGAIVLRAQRLSDLPAGHRQFVIVFDETGSAITKKLLSVRDVVIEVPLTSSGPAGQVDVGASHVATESPAFWAFFWLGVEHIWTGYDHLLFLFGLLVVCQSFRSSIAIVSCFTVAHSITLALATLDVVNLPPRLVEPVIAASIVYVGIENLVRRGKEPRGRAVLTFVFGLVHGFGFAGVLRDLGIGREGAGSIAMPLFSFNLGVEVGQIVIATMVLPIVWHFRKRPGFVRRGVPALSWVVVAAGLFWLLERTVF